MFLVGLTILRDRLFFSFGLVLLPPNWTYDCAPALGWRWPLPAGVSCRRRPESCGGVSIYYLYTFHFLLCLRHWIYHVRGVNLFLLGDFWSGGWTFSEEGDLFFFWGDESPLFGENKAFMVKPSDQQAISDGTNKAQWNVFTMRSQNEGRKGGKWFNLRFYMVTYSSPGERSRHRMKLWVTCCQMNGKIHWSENAVVSE